MQIPRTLPLVLLLALTALPLQILVFNGCSSSKTERNSPSTPPHRDGDEEFEREEEESPPRPPQAPPTWFGGMHLEATDHPGDTIAFHIGSPLLLRLELPSGSIACEAFNGRPFYFDAAGAQVGWGFEEVADSMVLPRDPSRCDRFVFLSSESSNRMPEGDYTLKVLIFVDEHRQLYSDTVVIRAVRSASGADTLSYARFLQEQILKNSPLLGDPETLRAVFGDGTPRSATSEIYRALIYFRGGDTPGARAALTNSRLLEETGRSRAPGTTAERLRHILSKLPGLSP